MALRVERIEIRAFHLDGVAMLPAPLFVEVEVFPTVADRGPDFAPSCVLPQHINDHPPAIAPGLVAVKLQKAIFPIRKVRPAFGRGARRSVSSPGIHNETRRNT